MLCKAPLGRAASTRAWFATETFQGLSRALRDLPKASARIPGLPKAFQECPRPSKGFQHRAQTFQDLSRTSKSLLQLPTCFQDLPEMSKDSHVSPETLQRPPHAFWDLLGRHGVPPRDLLRASNGLFETFQALPCACQGFPKRSRSVQDLTKAANIVRGPSITFRRTSKSLLKLSAGFQHLPRISKDFYGSPET